MDQTVLEMAGVPVSIHGDRYCPPLFSGFRTTGRAPGTVPVRWNIHPHPVPERLATVPPPRGAFNHIPFRNGRLFRLRRSSGDATIWKAALMGDGYHRGDIWINGSGHPDPDPLFFLDLLLWSHLLITYEALIIHAAAVKYQGRAFLFPGYLKFRENKGEKIPDERRPPFQKNLLPDGR